MPEGLKDKTKSGVLWSFIDNFASQFIAFFIGIILARLLSPSDYGLLAMLAIFTAIANTFINSGLGSALIRKKKLTEEDCSTAFYFNVVVAISCYFILFILAPYIADFYNKPILSSILRINGIGLIGGSLIVVQKSLINKQINFKITTKISVISNIFSGVVGIYMAYTNWGVWSLVGSSLSQVFIQFLLFWYYSKWRPRWTFSKVSFHYLFGYGSKLLASGLLDTIFENIYPIIIGKLFSPASLGYYTRAQNLAQLPSSNITGVIQRVTFPVLSEMQDDNERLAQSYRRLLKMSAFIIFPMMIGLAAVAEPLIKILLTDKWLPCVIYLQIICFAMMWYPIHAINLNLLQVKGRSDLFLRLEIIKKILVLMMIFIAVPFGVIGICASSVIISLIALVINTYYTGKLIKVGFLTQIYDLFPTILGSLLMGAVVYLGTFAIDNAIFKLSTGIVLGIFVYVLFSYISKSSEFFEILNLIKRKN